MTGEEHNKTLATLWFIYGAMHGLTLLGLLLLILIVRLSVSDALSVSVFWIAIAVITFVMLIMIVGLLPLVIGIGFRKRSRWLKPLAFALSIVSLINIPIGTALGIYTIKFFRSDAGINLYGGKTSSASEGELSDAMRGAQPLMSWADRLK
jgi:Mg2+/Co2+ transporter CorB